MGIFSSDEFGYFEWQEEHQKVMKYKKALKEIKEIAENNLNIHSCAFTGCGYDLITNQILQKINEVIDEGKI